MPALKGAAAPRPIPLYRGLPRRAPVKSSGASVRSCLAAVLAPLPRGRRLALPCQHVGVVVVDIRYDHLPRVEPDDVGGFGIEIPVANRELGRTVLPYVSCSFYSFFICTKLLGCTTPKTGAPASIAWSE